MGTVIAKTRKRCPHCHKMIGVGESAVLTDDRYRSEKINHFGRSYPRGAWHLWHEACNAERLTRNAEFAARANGTAADA